MLASDLPIRLTVPARHEFGRVVRLGLLSLGMRLGMPHRDVADLALALDEALIYLLRPEGSPGRITVTMLPRADGLEVTATTTAGSDQHWDDLGARKRFQALTTGVVDEVEIGGDGSRVKLVKTSH